MTKNNYAELVELYGKYAEGGLEILAFPCNQFGKQEPGSPEDIRAFADGKGVTFPMMAKIDVNGPATDPVYQLLKGAQGHDIRWNFFTKFLVSCRGETCNVSRFDGAPKPSVLENDIKKVIGTPSDEL